MIRDHKHDKNSAINCYFKSGSVDINDLYSTRPPSGILNGPESIAIPGELKCLVYAYNKYASLYWKALSQPAIDLATNGFSVSKVLGELNVAFAHVVVQARLIF